MALQFAAAGRMKAGGDASSSAAREIAGAVGGGAVGALLVTPFECVMVQQQLLGTSLLQTPLDIVRRHGALDGLYRGLGLAALRDSIYVGCMLGLTPVARSRGETRPRTRHSAPRRALRAVEPAAATRGFDARLRREAA